MGCLLRLGCLIVLLVAAVVAFLTRDRWMSHLPGRSAPPAGVVVTRDWTPLSQGGAERTRQGLQKLSSNTGPVFVTLEGADVASYVMSQIAKQLPATTDSFAARVVDDKIVLRANMRMSELGSSVLGPIGSLLRDREHVEMSGTLHVIGKGLAQFRVAQVRVRDFPVPQNVISRLIKPLVPSPRPAGLDENALPVSIPAYIGDVRIARGKITLYKNVQ